MIFPTIGKGGVFIALPPRTRESRSRPLNGFLAEDRRFLAEDHRFARLSSAKTVPTEEAIVALANGRKLK